MVKCRKCSQVFKADSKLDIIKPKGKFTFVCPQCNTSDYLVNLEILTENEMEIALISLGYDIEDGCGCIDSTVVFDIASYLGYISNLVPLTQTHIFTLGDSLDKLLEVLWAEFSNTPVTEDGEYIDDDFYKWKKGTKKEEIWYWFDTNHSKGLAVGLMKLR